MGKYDPLASFLGAREEPRWDASFADVERVLGASLPPSATSYREWWANQSGAGHSQARAWTGIGWQTGKVDLAARRVEFTRVKRPRAATNSSLPDRRIQDERTLFATAGAWIGTTDRDTLIHAGLTALIEREAARRLSRRGGTMPDFEAPPRRRPA